MPETRFALTRPPAAYPPIPTILPPSRPHPGLIIDNPRIRY